MSNTGRRLDRIRLDGMTFYGYHGVDPAEQALGQRFIVDLEVGLDLRPAGRSDDLARTVNYSALFKLVRAVMEGPSRALLETLAEEIAGRVLAECPVQQVRVRVHKPEVPIKGSILRGAAVEIERQRENAALAPAEVSAPANFLLEFRERRLDLRGRTGIMGILNVTPDSFFDGGRYAQAEAAVARGLELAAQGADLLDVGGQSTSSQARTVGPEEEIRRVVPVVRELAGRTTVPLSVDTSVAAVAEAALQAGAHLVNDVTGLGDPDMAGVVARYGAGLVLTHLRGTPKQHPPDIDSTDVVGEVVAWLRGRAEQAKAAGVDPRRLILDPGLGLGKLLNQDMALLRGLPWLCALGYPVLVAPSRKDFIGHALGGLPPEERLEGTAAVVACAITRGANLVRVHDVPAMVRVARMTETVLGWRLAGPAGRIRSDGTLIP